MDLPQWRAARSVECEPALHDLRESGDREQDADKVLFLHRPQDNPLTGLPQPENSLPSEVPTAAIVIAEFTAKAA